MPVYKLTYFDFRARAEVSRLLFAIAGVEFEDHRIPRDQWPGSYKEKTPFGKLPILEVDGKILCQSHSIERYLARVFGLAGQNDWEQARVDMVVECLDDFRKQLVPIRRETDEKKKVEMGKRFFEEEGPEFLDKFEKLLKSNEEGKQGHFVGDKMTLADVAFFHYTSNAASLIGQEQLTWSWERWPGLASVRENVARNQRVKDWIARRPKSSA